MRYFLSRENFMKPGETICTVIEVGELATVGESKCADTGTELVIDLGNGTCLSFGSSEWAAVKVEKMKDVAKVGDSYKQE